MQHSTFRRIDLVEQVSDKVGLSQKESEIIILSIMDHIKAALLERETVKIAGFGVFSVVERKPTLGRNVKVGKTVKIPARHVIVFKPSEKLKSRVESKLREI